MLRHSRCGACVQDVTLLLALVIVLVWGKLAGFSGFVEKSGDCVLSLRLPATTSVASELLKAESRAGNLPGGTL